MTYCLAMRMQAGLVFGSDTRTSAGVDYVTSYNKIWPLPRPPWTRALSSPWRLLMPPSVPMSPYMPFDIAIYPRDSLVAPLRQEVTMESAYYLSFQAQWQAGLCQTFEHLPSLTWPRPI